MDRKFITSQFTGEGKGREGKDREGKGKEERRRKERKGMRPNACKWKWNTL